MFDVLRADYKRHGSRLLNPTFWTVGNYHFGILANNLRFPLFRWLANKVYSFNLFLILITTGNRLRREVQVGKDLHLVHSGLIIVNSKSVIGDRCGIMHGVTIGSNMKPGAPTIGNDVFIGAGAKVLGKITIGDNVTIAANSLVITDVPSDCIAIGVPAVVRQKKDKSANPEEQ